MNSESFAQLKLLELDLLDAKELERQLPDGSCTVEKEDLALGDHGDLATTADVLITLGPYALVALTAWISKRQIQNSKVIKFRKVSSPGEVVIEYESEEISSQSDLSAAEVLQQLIAKLHLDPALFGEILSRFPEILTK